MGKESVFVSICVSIRYDKLARMRCPQTGDFSFARNCGKIEM